MTDEELKALVASLAVSQKETDRQLKELSQSQKETDRQFDEELKALVASLAVSQKETDRQLKELSQSQKETDRQFKETRTSLAVSQKETDRQLKELSQSQKETDRQLKKLGQQIGGLGNKFGGFTEGLALPSMSKILEEDFGMDTIAPRLKRKLKRNAEAVQALELDVLGYTNSQINTACVVEVKSRLNEQSIEQMLKTLEAFPRFFPEHQDKTLYGILAFVDFREDFLSQAEKSGLYLAHIHEDLFKIISSPDFQPKNFGKI